MAQQSEELVPRSSYFRSILLVSETWLSLFGGIACLCVYGDWPLHPKDGEHAVRAIIGFSIVAAVGVGMSLNGMRHSNGFTKVVAFTAFVLFAIVVLDIANILIHV